MPNPAQGYFDGMLKAAFGVTIISGNAAEWQIDAVKERASKLKEDEINHSLLSSEDKEIQIRQWKEWINAYADGFKDVLRQSGRMY